ncbi:MAG: hypothetical protein OEY94_00815 [Alphaproteobacteria bacterium]|nr:hypothetical protein [Alphaproteobacteria bacterium]
MFDYDDIENFHIPDFKLFHLSLYEAARFAAKIRLLEGYLDIDHPDEPEFYDLNNPVLDKLLKEQYEIFENALLKAAQNGSLKVAHLERDIHDEIDIAHTYIDIHDLADWLDKRGTSIYGDFFAGYQDKQFDLYWIAERAVKAELVRRENQAKRNIFSDQDLIVHLQEQNESLKKAYETNNQNKPKPLHTKERETLLKIIAGMATDAYGYDPNAARSPIPREIADILAEKEIPLDPDTVRKWLKEAAEILPQSPENPDD